jgi:phosphoribosylpyrophosphate synthetase
MIDTAGTLTEAVEAVLPKGAISVYAAALMACCQVLLLKE